MNICYCFSTRACSCRMCSKVWIWRFVHTLLSVVRGMVLENAHAATNARLHVQAHVGMPLRHLSTPAWLFSHDDSHLPCRNDSILMGFFFEGGWEKHRSASEMDEWGQPPHAERIATFRPKQAWPWSRSSHSLLVEGSAAKQTSQVVISPCRQIYRAHVRMYVKNAHMLAY